MFFRPHDQDHVIEITLPDGKHYFKGVALIGEGLGAIYCNDWRMNICDLEPGSGIFSLDQCLRWLPIISIDGCSIRKLKEVTDELQKAVGGNSGHVDSSDKGCES